MKIYIDADACPQAAKQILFKAAIRTSHLLILVANKFGVPLAAPDIAQNIFHASF